MKKRYKKVNIHFFFDNFSRYMAKYFHLFTRFFPLFTTYVRFNFSSMSNQGDENPNDTNDHEEEADDEGENEEEKQKLDDTVNNQVSALIGGDNEENGNNEEDGDNEENGGNEENRGFSSASELPTDVIADEEEKKNQESAAYKDALEEELQNPNYSDHSSGNTPRNLLLTNAMSQTEDTFRITQPPPKEEQIFAKTQPIPSTRPRTSRSARHSRTRRSNCNPDDVSALSTKLLNGEKVQCDDPDLMGASITELEEQRDDLINSGKYMESVKYQNAIDNGKSQHLDLIKKQVSQETLEDINFRKNETQEKYNTMLKDMKDHEVILEDRYNKSLQNLKNRQEREITELEEEYSSEEKRRQYNRSSQRLRILRTQQALLIRTKRFDEALQVSKIADNLAQKETQQNHARMIADFNQAKAIIEAKHAEEYNTFIKKYEDRRKELNSRKEQESRPYENRMTTLRVEEEIAKEPEKIWAKKRNEQNELTARQLRKTSITVKPDVKEFNTLPLPPLPESSRKSAKSNKPK